MKADDLGRHRIGAVARLTGISEHVLRVWERRYRTVTPSRPHGGQRLYNDDDVARLRRLKHLTDLGHSIGSVARLTDTEIEALLQRHPEARLMRKEPARETEDDSKRSLIETIRARFLESIATLDVDSANRLIARALVAFEPLELIEELIAPLIQEVGNRWEHSSFSIAQEHAATAVFRSQLGGVIRMTPPRSNAALAVCATPAGEQHEFGALFAALVCAARGWRVVYLGASLPVEEIARAAVQTDARAVMLSIVALPEVESARQVSQLRTLLPRSIALYLGGRAIDPQARFVGVHYLADLAALVRVLDAAET